MTDDQDKHAERLLSLDDLLKLVPVGKRSLLRMEKQGLFPAAYYLSPNRRAWKESEVAEWQANLANQRFFKPASKRQRVPADARSTKRGKTGE